jgi:hypothetical protein
MKLGVAVPQPNSAVGPLMCAHTPRAPNVRPPAGVRRRRRGRSSRAYGLDSQVHGRAHL